MTSVPRILVVDDDEGMRQSLGRVLRAKGYDVVTACDGESALETARSILPDMTILDIRMPGMDGIQTLELMRRERPSTRAMLMTAYAASFDTRAACINSETQVVGKPLNLAELCEMLRVTLQSA